MTAAGFEPVRDAVAQVLEAQNAGGVAVAAIVDGQPVVDLWAGDVGRETLIHTWSAIKPMVGTCLLLLVDRGHIALDDVVVRFWPELGAARDSQLRVGDVLCHAAGLASLPLSGTAASLLEWDRTCERLAIAEPDWQPGSAVGEHALTYGHLVGELVDRVDGRSIGRFLAEELAGPTGLTCMSGLWQPTWGGSLTCTA
jgi:CubicO group peptidase (beta-lactamase class C family)